MLVVQSREQIITLKYLVKRTDYNAKILDIEAKSFSSSDYNQFKGEIRDANIKEKGLVGKFDISWFKNKSNLDKKITTLAIKVELEAQEDKITSLKVFAFRCFRGKSHFEDDETQNYLALQPVYNYFKAIANGNKVTAQKPMELSGESIKHP